MIKSSKIKINFANKNKHNKYNLFLTELNSAVIFYVNYLWNNKIIYEKNRILDIKNDLLDCPSFLTTNFVKYETSLSVRAKCSAITQACSIINGIINQKRNLIFLKNKLESEGKIVSEFLLNKINNIKLKEPILKNINVELGINNIKYEISKNTSFDAFMILSSMGYKHGEKVYIPIKHNRHFNRLLSKGKIMTSFKLNKKYIEVRFDIPETPIKTTETIVGADSVINHVITLSDTQQSQADIHGHTLNSIIKKIINKQKGSKARKRAKEHKKNYINACINKLNLSNIKQVNLEKISDFRYKKNIGKFLNQFNATLIRNKIKDFCSQQGVLVVEQSSPYRSRRCFKCGYVNENNRKRRTISLFKVQL